MGYADGERRTYSLGSRAFTTAATIAIKGPKGRQGRLEEIQVGATVLFTAVTTPAHLLVGILGDTDAYGDLSLGTLAAAAALSASVDQPLALIQPDIPADTTVLFSIVAPTGGSPAGTGDSHVVIRWF